MSNGYCAVAGAVVRGAEALPVQVEVEVVDRMPGMYIVGMPDLHIQEARERVRAAVRSAGFTMPNERIVVNLAPNDLRKEGTGLVIAIAAAILVATGQIAPQAVEGKLFAGELALDGRVLPVRGTVAYALAARDMGCAFVGSARCADVIEIEGVEQLGLENLADLRSGNLKALVPSSEGMPSRSLDFKDVAGQEVAKRGLQIAAAGGHGVLIVGAPGSGKTMLASRVPSILPPLEDDERIQAALVHSVAGLPFGGIVEGVRPLRMPHFSVTLAGMLGGGRAVLPGEVALANGGVLVLDDVAEFSSSVLQGLRHAVGQGTVEIVRADGATSFPAHAQVIALASPCPCGCFGSDRDCTCSAAQIRVYQECVIGSVADMVDMRIEMRPAKASEFLSADEQVSSADLREGVMRARAFAARRMEREGRPVGFSDATPVNLDGEAQALLEDYTQKARMSLRGISKVLKVARTIADMAESEKVMRDHVAEALSFRM